MESAIYSTGHGNKHIDKFIQEVKSFNIKYLLDIRSVPYSKWNSKFKKKQLEKELRNHGIIYVYVGDKLGGRPTDKSCYDTNGNVDYELIKEKAFFHEGIQRLITANEKNIKLAIMCSETKPEKCHRSKLIGEELLKHEISLKHIIAEKQIILQEDLRGLFSI